MASATDPSAPKPPALDDQPGLFLPREGVRRFYCAVCRVERRTRLSSQPSWRHFAKVGLVTAVVALALAPWWGARGVVVFIPFWIAFELMYRLRVRQELACLSCGFDPFLQLRDRVVARRALDTHWRAKFAEKGLPWPADSGEPVIAPRVERPELPDDVRKPMDELLPEARRAHESSPGEPRV